jgi:hypothetical protein
MFVRFFLVSFEEKLQCCKLISVLLDLLCTSMGKIGWFMAFLTFHFFSPWSFQSATPSLTVGRALSAPTAASGGGFDCFHFRGGFQEVAPVPVSRNSILTKPDPISFLGWVRNTN